MPHLAGFGSYLPARELTNEELASEFGIEPQWVLDACGIRTRRIASPDETAAFMANAAATKALTNAGLTARDLGGIVVGTGTPDRQFPGVSAALQRTLEVPGVPAFDVHL